MAVAHTTWEKLSDTEQRALTWMAGTSRYSIFSWRSAFSGGSLASMLSLGAVASFCAIGSILSLASLFHCECLLGGVDLEHRIGRVRPLRGV